MRKLTNYFLAGLVALLPTAATLYVLGLVAGILNGVGGRFERWLGIDIPGLGAVATVLMVVLFGVVATNVFGRKLVSWYDDLLGKTPVIKTIYATVKQVIDVIANPKKSSFKKMVMVEWPSAGLWTVGYLVSEDSIDGMSSVFVPTPPNPAGGFVVLVERSRYKVLDMSMEDGVKFVLSCGVIADAKRELMDGNSKPEAGDKDL